MLALRRTLGMAMPITQVDREAKAQDKRRAPAMVVAATRITVAPLPLLAETGQGSTVNMTAQTTLAERSQIRLHLIVTWISTRRAGNQRLAGAKVGTWHARHVSTAGTTYRATPYLHGQSTGCYGIRCWM